MSSAGSWAFTYDANGNQTERLVSAVADRTIAWDGDNRPISVTNPSGTITYLYGPDGSRLKKIVGSNTTLYLGDDIERDSAGIFAFNLTPDVKLANSNRTYLHRDHLQSVRRVTDAAGTLSRASPTSPSAPRSRPSSLGRIWQPKTPASWRGSGLTHHAVYPLRGPEPRPPLFERNGLSGNRRPVADGRLDTPEAP